MTTTSTPSSSEYVSCDSQCYVLATNDNVLVNIMSPKGVKIRVLCSLDDAIGVLEDLRLEHDPKNKTNFCLYITMAKFTVRDRKSHRALDNPTRGTQSRCTCGGPMSTLRNGVTYCLTCDIHLLNALRS